MVGDEVLKHVAACLKNSFRSMDVLCRWGGDEFMVLMRGITGVTAIQSRLKRLTIFMKALEEKDEPLKVTLSMGAAVKRKEESFERLFRRTDELLYQVKKNGRNSFLIEE